MQLIPVMEYPTTLLTGKANTSVVKLDGAVCQLASPPKSIVMLPSVDTPNTPDHKAFKSESKTPNVESVKFA